MDCTTFAPHMATMAMGARPCTALGHGYRWRGMALVISAADLGFVQENFATKRTTRRLGRLTT